QPLAPGPLCHRGSGRAVVNGHQATVFEQRQRSLDPRSGSVLRAYGIEPLVEEGRTAWQQSAAHPDLAAMTMRSRVSEAAALLDPNGLGAFSVVEWRH
ncbi:MAG: hypothetical protein ACKOBR_04860, partial [Actinomycetota bacterium]